MAYIDQGNGLEFCSDCQVSILIFPHTRRQHVKANLYRHGWEQRASTHPKRAGCIRCGWETHIDNLPERCPSCERATTTGGDQ